MRATVLRRWLPVLLAVMMIGLRTGSAFAVHHVTIGSGSAFPGSTGTVTVSLTNDSTIAGFQLRIRDAPDSLDITKITMASRLSSVGFSVPTFNNVISSNPDSSGVGIILGFGFTTDPTKQKIFPGSGPIFTIEYTVSKNTPPGIYNLNLDQVVLSKPNANTIPGITVTHGTFTVLPNLTLADHPSGQISDRFGGSSVATIPLYRFKLTEAEENATVTSLVFSLSGVSGLSPSNFSGMQIVEDANGNGVVDVTETTTVGGTGVVSITGSTGTITFPSSFTVPVGSRQYILRGAVNTGSTGNVTVNLNLGGITATAVKAGGLFPQGAAAAVTHSASGVTLADHTGAGQVPDRIGDPGTLTNVSLFRFSVSGSGETTTITRLSFGLGLTQVVLGDLSAFSLFEDTGQDGQPDGAALASAPAIDNTSITFDNLSIALQPDQIRSFVVQGTVIMDQPGDRIIISLQGAGVTAGDAVGNAVSAVGAVGDAVQALGRLVLADAPQGQIGSPLNSEGTLTDLDLFRFSLTASMDTITVAGMAFDLSLAGLGPDHITDMKLFEDTTGDGLPDGAPLASGAVAAPSAPATDASVLFSDLTLRILPDQSRTFVLQAAVVLDSSGVTMLVRLTPDRITADDAAGNRVTVTGAATPAAHLASQITVMEPPSGQMPNQFIRAASVRDRDLFRFALHSTNTTLVVHGLSLPISLNGLTADGLSSFALYEDVNGDGTPDGVALPAGVSIKSDSLILNNLHIAFEGTASRTFVIRGSVVLRRVGNRLTMNLSGDGVAATIDLPEVGRVNVSAGGAVTAAVHEADGFAGDVNLDLRLDITDVVGMVRVVLELDPLKGPLERYDIDGNGRIDIADIVAVIDKILTGDIPTKRLASPDRPVVFTLEGATDINDGFTDLTVRLDSPTPLAGIQLAISSSHPDIAWENPLLLDKATRMTLASHATNGKLRVLIYSLTGERLPVGPIPLIRLRLPTSGHDQTVFTVEEAYAVEAGARFAPVSVSNRTLTVSRLPHDFSLGQNAPNPFNPATVIRYDLPEAGHVVLTVYNILGQEIVRLVDAVQEAGRYTARWDGRNTGGQAVANGVYIYRLTVGDRFTSTRKMTLLR